MADNAVFPPVRYMKGAQRNLYGSTVIPMINPKLRRTFFTEDISFRFGATFFVKSNLPSHRRLKTFVLQFKTFAAQKCCNS